MIGNKTYFIDQINSSKAYKMTSLYHYSGVGFKKATLNLGVFRQEDKKLVGVLQWGISYQDGIKLNRYVKEPIDKTEYLELNRFSMADSEGKNAESQAISLGIKWIKKYRPEIKLLVSYAGRKEGNYGYIYQATNWEYLGYFISEGFWSLDGHEKHLVTLWYRYDRSGSTLPFKEYFKSLHKDVRKTWTKQFIYIQRLDKKLTVASPVLPYPKETNEFPIKIREDIIIQDDEVYNNPIPVERKFVEYYWEPERYLFTLATRRRHGEADIPRKNKYIGVYDNFGELEKTYYGYTDLLKDYPDLVYNSIYNAIKTGKKYKEKFFRTYIQEDDIVEAIDIPYICVIDGIPFCGYAEAGRYLGTSRQAIQQSQKRQSKQICGKEVIWIDD